MKTTSLIPPALLITGLLLSGCSGLDDPDDGDGGGSTPSEYIGAYTFDLINDLGSPCADNLNKTMEVDADGVITSTTFNDGIDNYTLSGFVNSNGAIDGVDDVGHLDFTAGVHDGTFDGVLSTELCGTGLGIGEWRDIDTGCNGSWTACIP